MYDHGDDCDDQKNVNQAPCHVECEPTKHPRDNEDDRQDQKPREEHGGLLFGLLSFELTLT